MVGQHTKRIWFTVYNLSKGVGSNHTEGLTKIQNKNISYIQIRVITKLPNSEQSYKGEVKTHKYINRQNQSTTGKLWKP
jgi:hypothetical protein